MSDSPLSGDAIVDAFFAELQDMDGVDKALAEKLASLHRDKKFTQKEVAASLQSLREEALKNG